MKQSRLIWIITYSITTIIFGWAVFTWIGAVNYDPVTPERAPLNKFDFQVKATGSQLSRYQGLVEGGLFFEKPLAAPMAQILRSEFQSRLVVYGLVKGKDSRAIVGLEGDPNQETWIVRPSSKVEEETIVGIGEDFIEVRNGSGVGKVFFKK